MIAKIGGTEFTVIMELNHLHTQVSSQDQAQWVKFAKALICASHLPFYLSAGQKCEIGLNVGATAFPEDTNSVEFYSKKLVEASRKRIEMEEQLRNAISNQELELYLQPMLDLASGKIIKAEALIRWHHPNGNWVSPGEFIALAEQTRLIIAIGK